MASVRVLKAIVVFSTMISIPVAIVVFSTAKRVPIAIVVVVVVIIWSPNVSPLEWTPNPSSVCEHL